MALILHPLFGLSCFDEAMPGGQDPDCQAAMLDAEPLRAAMEKMPAPTREATLDNTPDYVPEPAPAAGPAFGPRR